MIEGASLPPDADKQMLFSIVVYRTFHDSIYKGRKHIWEVQIEDMWSIWFPLGVFHLSTNLSIYSDNFQSSACLALLLSFYSLCIFMHLCGLYFSVTCQKQLCSLISNKFFIHFVFKLSRNNNNDKNPYFTK